MCVYCQEVLPYAYVVLFIFDNKLECALSVDGNSRRLERQSSGCHSPVVDNYKGVGFATVPKYAAYSSLTLTL